MLPERKEYERTATMVVNAYVRPVMKGYLGALGDGLRGIGCDAPLLIMQSAGGLTPEADAVERPVFVLESGPAAGVLAAAAAAEAGGIGNRHHPRHGGDDGEGLDDRRGPRRLQPGVRSRLHPVGRGAG